MSEGLTQKELGRRIASLRKQKNLSQADLATRLGISRPSLTQIELGNRNIDTLELQKLSGLLGFSIDNFMSENFLSEDPAGYIPLAKPPKTIERISDPEIHVSKFRNVLLYILEHCAGKPNVDEAVLHKLMYFCDFNYFELYEEHLTGSLYQKLSMGPFPQKINSILNKMIEDGQLQRIFTTYKEVPQTRYLPLEKADLRLLKASEKEVIDRVMGLMSDWSGSAMSEFACRDMPCLASKDGEIINYELVFYRQSPFSVRNYSED